MIFVSAFYVVTWLPVHVYYLLISFSGNASVPESFFHITILLVFLYAGVNPFIYATKFTPVKQVLVDLMPCKKSQQTSASDGTRRMQNGR